MPIIPHTVDRIASTTQAGACAVSNYDSSHDNTSGCLCSFELRFFARKQILENPQREPTP